MFLVGIIFNTPRTTGPLERDYQRYSALFFIMALDIMAHPLFITLFVIIIYTASNEEVAVLFYTL